MPGFAVYGANGFLGRLLAGRLSAERITREHAAPDAPGRLHTLLDGRTVVFVAVTAPIRGRSDEAFAASLAAIDPLIAAEPERVVYLGSDAVYPYDVLVGDDTPPAPITAYGEMHLERERRLAERFGDRLLRLRLTQVYGAGDRNNAYGPMRMLRDALSAGTITLFGDGSERRDHIHVDDVVEAIAQLAHRDISGVLNVATGRSVTFRAIADEIAGLVPGAKIVHAERRQPVMHRDFGEMRLLQLLPAWKARPVGEGLKTVKLEVEGEWRKAKNSTASSRSG